MLVPGQRLGRYELVRQIAQGGMATVWLAQLAGAHGFEKWVAIKVIHQELAADPRHVSMFLDEVRVVSRIRHSNVCAVLDLGTVGDVPYLVMEYLGGVPFSAALRRGWRRDDVPPQLVARVLTEAARGIHAAHELRGDDGELLNVVHRDVSPQNIMVEHDGAVKVVDFGIARARGKLAVTRVGELRGKLSYMAPEQLLLAPVDRRADVWSLGVLLWEATVGDRLFYGEDRAHTVGQILRGPIRPPSEVRPSYPKALEPIVLAALERDPQKRTPTAAAFADALERWLYSTGEPFGATQVAAWIARHFGPAGRPSDPPDPSDASLPLPPEPPARVTASVPSNTVPELAPPSFADDPQTPRSEPVPSVRPRPGNRTRGWILPAAIAALAGLIGVIAWVASREPPPLPNVTSNESRAVGDRATTDVAEVGAVTTQVVDDPVGDELAEPEAPPEPDSVGDEAALEREPEPVAARTDRAPRVELRNRRAAREPVERPGRELAPASEDEEARPETAPGLLNLLAIPQSTVRFRGRVIGRTPLFERSFPPGRHTLTLEPVAGGSAESITVDIRSGEVAYRRVRLDGY